MDIKRGKPPTFVERELVVDVTRDEIIAIVTSYIKKRLNTENVKLDDVEVVGSADGKLESMTLVGSEQIPLTWKDNSTTTQPSTPTTPVS